MAMTPLERIRLTSAGPVGGTSASQAARGWITPSSGMRWPVSARPVWGRPVWGWPARDAGVLIRLLWCVVMLGRSPHDVICFAEPGGWIRAVRVVDGAAALAARVPSIPRAAATAAQCPPGGRRRDDADGDPDDHQSQGAEIRRLHRDRRCPAGQGSATGGEQAEFECGRAGRRRLDANRNGSLLKGCDGHRRLVGQDFDPPVAWRLYIETYRDGLAEFIEDGYRHRAGQATESDMGRIDHRHQVLARGEISRDLREHPARLPRTTGSAPRRRLHGGDRCAQIGTVGRVEDAALQPKPLVKLRRLTEQRSAQLVGAQ